MNAHDWLLTVSLILNGVLGALVYFQTAVNNLITHWLKIRFIDRPSASAIY
jgi:hypothetical protein